MNYRVISADCHIDLIWLPPDLFTSNARSAMKNRMPFVTDSDDGPLWVSRAGARFGLQNGMGSAGRKYVPGENHRADRMAQTGLYEDGRKGVRRVTDPHLRIKDQDLDSIQAEVRYGILGAAERLDDPDAATEMMRIYNEWLDDFCAAYPDRFAGIASIPNHDMSAAVEEVRRVTGRGVTTGLEVSATLDMKPLYDPVGLRLIDLLGEDTIMWSSDFPHPDGVWPDSQAIIERELAAGPEATRRKLVCENAARAYGFSGGRPSTFGNHDTGAMAKEKLT